MLGRSRRRTFSSDLIRKLLLRFCFSNKLYLLRCYREKFFLASKMKFFKGRCYETFNCKEEKKEKREESKECGVDEELEVEEDVPVRLFTHVINIFHQFFSVLRCRTTIRKFTTLMACMCSTLTFPTTSKKPHSE